MGGGSVVDEAVRRTNRPVMSRVAGFFYCEWGQQEVDEKAGVSL